MNKRTRKLYEKARLVSSIAEARRHNNSFSPLVTSIVNKVASRTNSPVDREELMAEGLLGLVRAARDFNPDNASNAQFVTYASIRIYSAVQDLVRARAMSNARMPLTQLSTEADTLHTAPSRKLSRDTRRMATIAVECFRQLPPEQEYVMMSCFLMNRSDSEIAKFLKCSTAHVDKHRKNALATVRAIMEAKGICG